MCNNHKPKKKRVNRRDFLKYLTYGTCGAAIHSSLLPGLRMQTIAHAQNRAAIPNGLLYVINLAGGASYNIAPIYSGAWRDKNPSVSYGEGNSLPLNGEQGLHPSLSYLKSLFDDGDLALLNEVGFPNQEASRSHNTAAMMWMTGKANPTGEAGVMNLLSCQMSGLYSAVSLAGSDPIADGGCPGMRALEGLSSLNGERFLYSDSETAWLERQRQRIEAANRNTNASAAHVRGAISNMDKAAERIRSLISTNLPDVGFNPPGGGFGSDIVDAAKLTAASSATGTRMFYLERGGFDTHSGERNRLTGNLNDINAGIRYLAEVNKALGVWNRTIILVISEFARTFENSSAGTDHGHVKPVFVMGGGVRGRVVNSAPSAGKIQSASSFLRDPAIDDRSIWHDIIVRGMGLNPNAVLDTSGYSQSDLRLFT